MIARYRTLVVATACLTFIVVVVGAYVRLMDAGLGCPDWPGCYGEVTPLHAMDKISSAIEAQGGEHGPVSLRKAWKEMVHRYLAGTLGFMILAITVTAWRRRRVLGSPALPTALLALVIFQAALGMWTVTLLLKPVIVTLHLLGGMATLALATWLALRQRPRHLATLGSLSTSREPGDASEGNPRFPSETWPRHLAKLGSLSTRRDPVNASEGNPRFPSETSFPLTRLRVAAAIGLAIVVVQIALGGWVSSNYAALACVDLPTCHGEWMPSMDFRHGFQLVRDLGRTADGGHLAYEALTAIHWTHRVGALVTFVYVGALAIALMRLPRMARHGAALAAVLAVQVGLGIANVAAGLPLAVAVAHNAVAAILLVSLVVINFDLSRFSLPS
jgi:cytochrome c oxidase assembly protein subunit 15